MSRPGDPPADVAPYRFTAPLGVCVNVVHPQAYLAFGPVRALAAELAVAIDWLPFPAPPPKPGPDGAAGSTDRGTRHRAARARYQASEIQRYAEAQGLVIQDPSRQADPLPGCLGHLWLSQAAPERVPEYLEVLFTGHWAGEFDAGDVALIADVVDDLAGGAEAFERFAAGDGPVALADLRGRLVAAGVPAVPAVVVEEEVFIGHAHLPAIRWRLGGRVGPAPV